MVRAWESPKWWIEHGIEKSISIKNLVIAEAISGIIDQTLLSNGYSTLCMVAQASLCSKDLWWTLVLESGLELSGSQSPSTWSVPSSGRENMIITPMITSISQTEENGKWNGNK